MPGALDELAAAAVGAELVRLVFVRAPLTEIVCALGTVGFGLGWRRRLRWLVVGFGGLAFGHVLVLVSASASARVSEHMAWDS